MHPILLILWLSSVPLLLGLSLVFLIGLGYYWFQRANQTHRFLWSLQAWLRGVFLVGIVLCFIPWKITAEETENLPSKILLIIDDSQSMSHASYTHFMNQVYDNLKYLRPSSAEINTIGLNSATSTIQELTPKATVSSWAKVQEIIRKESKGYQLSHVFFVTDAQLSELESPIHPGPKIHIIPFGKEVSNQTIGLSFPTKTLISVPGERIHIPISVWSNLNKNQKSPNIQVFIDGKLSQTLHAPGTFWKDFQQLDVELIDQRISKHVVRIQVENNSSLGQGFTWIVQAYQAKVEAFALAPNPNLGVISRAAEVAKINIHWNFGSIVSDLPKSDNYLFYGIIPKELPKDKSVWYLNIPVDQKKDWPPFEEFAQVGNYYSSVWKKNSEQRTSLFSSNTSFWNEQMAEMKNIGSFRLLDSSIHELFKISFLREADNLVSIELAKPQVNLGDEIVFEMRQLNTDLLNSRKIPVQWEISNANYKTHFESQLSEAHQIVNFKPSNPGKYQFLAKLNYLGKDLEFAGEFHVLDASPENIQGRNVSNLQVLAHQENVDIVEAADLKKQILDTKALRNDVRIQEINLWEWPYFGALMLIVLGLEWVIRKRLNQL